MNIIRRNILDSISSNKPISLSILLLFISIFVSALRDWPIHEPSIILLKIASMLLLGSFFYQTVDFFTKNEKKQFLKFALLGCLFGGSILLGDNFFHGKLAQIKCCESAKVYGKITLIISLIAPQGLFLIRHHFLKAVWIFFFGTVLYFGKCDTAFLAFIISSAVYYFFIFKNIQKYFFLLTKALIIIFILFLPSVMNIIIPAYKNQNGFISNEFSYRHRVEIWETLSSKITEKRFLGYGINAAKRDAVTGGEKEISHDLSNNSIKINYKIHHPHNYILQLWLELGFLGIVISIILLLSLLYKLKYSKTVNKSGFLAFCSAQIHLLFSISLWQTWWWVTLIFLLPVLNTVSKNNE